MRKTILNNNGFGAIGILLAIVIFAAIAAVGWVAYRHGKTKSSASVPTQTNKTTTTQTVTPDPYADWKTYCDSAGKVCFRYPTNWALDASASQVTLLNPANNLEVDYVSPYAHDSGLLAFQPTVAADLAAPGSNLKIVGGVYLPANEPDYGVVDVSLLSAYPLTIGQQTQFPNALRFTNTHLNGSSSDVAFRARATDPMSSQQAQAWFSSADAATALQVLKSLYFQ